MASRFAHPFNDSDLEPANDSIIHIASSTITRSTCFFPFDQSPVSSIPSASNDCWYDQDRKCECVGSAFVEKTIRIARRIREHSIVSGKSVDMFLKEHQESLASPVFIDTVVRVLQTSIRFWRNNRMESSIHSLETLKGNQIRFLGEKGWNAILLGNRTPQDMTRILGIRSVLIEMFTRKSDREILSTIKACTARKDILKLFGAFVSIADKSSIRADILR